MGCFWSSEDRNRCLHCNRVAVNELIIIDNICQICISQATRSTQSIRSGPCFGEYKCQKCGHFWNSRLSWPNSYKICKRCRNQVYAYRQRELRKTDKLYDKENIKEHPKELCQKCQQLGQYCGISVKQTRRKTYY